MTLVFARFAEKEQEQAEAQAVTIAELERTNTALQQALDENAALHAQLLVQAREAGVADERRRLAAEIHDTIAQGLTGIIAQLQVVANAPDLDIARTHLARASDLARHSLGEARRSVHNLAPVALENDGLPEALKKTVAEWAERTGVRAEFTVTGTGGTAPRGGRGDASAHRPGGPVQRLPPRRAPPALGVTLTFLGDEVILDIRDDGRGFDPLARPRTHAHRRLRPRRHARPRRTHRGHPHRRVRSRATARRCRLAYRWSAMTARRRQQPITLLIVDDHPVVRDGLRGMFASAPGFRVLGEASNGVEARRSWPPPSTPT